MVYTHITHVLEVAESGANVVKGLLLLLCLCLDVLPVLICTSQHQCYSLKLLRCYVSVTNHGQCTAHEAMQ